jgi:hypothetical protein
MKHTQQAHPTTRALAALAFLGCVFHAGYGQFATKAKQGFAGHATLQHAEINLQPQRESTAHD